MPTSAPPDVGKKTGISLAELSARKAPLEDVRKVGERADELYTPILYAYGYIWRILADSFVIALGGFALGLLGSVLGLPVWGLMVGAAFGFLMGYVIKGYILTVVSVPVGIVLGAALSLLPWALGMPPQGVFFIVSVFALGAAWMGTRRVAFHRRRKMEKVRPFLGLIGGLAFSGLGVLLGIGLQFGLERLLEQLMS